jgi:hypothetical protein
MTFQTWGDVADKYAAAQDIMDRHHLEVHEFIAKEYDGAEDYVRMVEAADVITGLEARVAELSRVILGGQWQGGDGMDCETRCPFCGADPHYGDWSMHIAGADYSLEKHAADCPVLAAYEEAGGAD